MAPRTSVARKQRRSVKKAVKKNGQTEFAIPELNAQALRDLDNELLRLKIALADAENQKLNIVGAVREKQAQLNEAARSVLTSLGLDPEKPHHVDLSTMKVYRRDL